jgi:hypothetical protein
MPGVVVSGAVPSGVVTRRVMVRASGGLRGGRRRSRFLCQRTDSKKRKREYKNSQQSSHFESPWEEYPAKTIESQCVAQRRRIKREATRYVAEPAIKRYPPRRDSNMRITAFWLAMI